MFYKENMNMSDANPNIQSGYFTSVDATGVLKSNGNKYSNGGNVKGDGGFFEITILRNEIHVHGENPIKGWKNTGYGIKADETEIKIGDEVIFTWSDLPSSRSPEKNYSHRVKVKIIDADTFQLIQVLKGKGTSFGSLKRIPTSQEYNYLPEEE